MNCQSLAEAIVDLARGVDVGRGATAIVETHLEHCRDCAARFRREQDLSEGLSALAASTAAGGQLDALERRLLERFEEQHAGPANRSHGTRYRWLQAAAMVAFATAAVVWWRLAGTTSQVPDVRPSPAPVDVQAKSAPPATPPAVSQGAKPVEPRIAAVRSSGRRGGHTTIRRTELVRPAGFIPLPTAVGLPDLESGEIVRMEIPIGSLPVYGLEIQPDTGGRPIKADLLVGQDGQARAIRLVRQ
jgi:hypothetical protein